MSVICQTLFLALILLGLSCSGLDHTEPLRRTGVFALVTPSLTEKGYSLLDEAYTTALADVQLDSLTWRGGVAGDSSTVRLAAGAAGGLLLTDGTTTWAPDYDYPETWLLSVKLFATPARFWLRCRDGKHYADLTLDSLRLETAADSTHRCRGYFRYTLNIEEGEREF